MFLHEHNDRPFPRYKGSIDYSNRTPLVKFAFNSNLIRLIDEGDFFIFDVRLGRFKFSNISRK
jgi:hypothetical protein